jgi:peptidoglycan/xylan/chitin deacetylase (PgdA/CDA1 family)
VIEQVRPRLSCGHGRDAQGLTVDVERSRIRRAQRRQEIRRRRLTALGVLVAIAVLLSAALALDPAGKHHPRSTATRSPSRSPSVSASAPPVRRGPPGKAAVPILMYHVIAAPPAGAPFPGLYVEPQLFAEQMQALKQAGWHAVTPDQVEAYWREGVPLGPGKPIVLSFDNGYQSQFTQALPVLRRLGWVAEENIQLTGLPPSQGGLGDDEIRGLIAAGWELDTQGISHADLIALSPSELHEQVAGARRTIQRRFHVPVNWFCYPSGHYDAAVVAEVKAAGYVGSTTVVPGWAHPQEDTFRMPRLRVLGGTSGAQLLSLIAATREDPEAPASYSGG